jgi:SLOG in TRPM, prokaryote
VARLPDIAARPDAPLIIPVTPDSAATDPALRSVIEDLRAQTDAYVFLAGGASRMDLADQQKLLVLFDALAIVARRGTRLLVGDGGTQAGIMEAAGKVREKSGYAFPLVGVVPASEIVTPSDMAADAKSKTPVDPHHSHIIAVDDRARDLTRDAWGTETQTMYELFARLARGRPSVTIVANGGEIVMSEVDENVRAGRPMILIAGSGRSADALVSLLDNTASTIDDVATLRAKAVERDLMRRRDLFHVFQLAGGSPDDLARVLAERLGSFSEAPARGQG